jgi:hypothetical protein
MFTKFHAYAASAPGAPLEPFDFDPGSASRSSTIGLEYLQKT